MKEETKQQEEVADGQLPGYHRYEVYQKRVDKLKQIRAQGIDPYPHRYQPTAKSVVLKERYLGKAVGTSETAQAGQTETVKVAGRLVLFRSMGKNAFGQLQDDSGRLQVMFSRDTVSVTGLNFDQLVEGLPNALKWIEKKIDLGDILGVEGELFRTHKGELTLLAR